MKIQVVLTSSVVWTVQNGNESKLHEDNLYEWIKLHRGSFLHDSKKKTEKILKKVTGRE